MDMLSVGNLMGSRAVVPSWVRAGANGVIDFRNNRAWFAGIGEVDPASLMTYSRNRAAYVLNSAGLYEIAAANAPGITDLGWVPEVAATNICNHSNDLEHAAWNKVGSSVPDTAQATPLAVNDNSARLVQMDTGTSAHYVGGASVSFTSGTSYMLSAIVKAGTHSLVQLLFTTSAFASAYANFDLSAGTITASSGVAASGIIPLGNGFYRPFIIQSATATISATAGILAFIDSPTAARLPSFTGTGGNVIVWHVQTETRPTGNAFPTSPIVTTTASATRPADICLVSNAIARSVILGAKAMYTETDAVPLSSNTPRLLLVTAADVYIIYLPVNQVRLSGYSTADATFGSGDRTGLVKCAFTMDDAANAGAGFLQAIANGGAPASAIAKWFPGNNPIYLGNNDSGGGANRALNGLFREIAFSPVAGNFDLMTAA